MRIYNLNKIHKEYIRDLIIKDLPKSITTDNNSTELKIDNNFEEISNLSLEYRTDMRYSNNIKISNIQIQDNWIIGNIDIIEMDKYRVTRRKEIDLLENNEYKILFKPSFETEILDSTEGLVATKFHNFNVFLINKVDYREERLSKLLDIN